MPRSWAKIHTSIWKDKDFGALDEGARFVYLHLLSHPQLNHAGVIPYQPRQIARVCGQPEAVIDARMQALVDADFIVLDAETDEILIRTLLVHDGGLANFKQVRAVHANADALASDRLSIDVWSTFLNELGKVNLTKKDGTPNAPLVAAVEDARLAGETFLENVDRSAIDRQSIGNRSRARAP